MIGSDNLNVFQSSIVVFTAMIIPPLISIQMGLTTRKKFLAIHSYLNIIGFEGNPITGFVLDVDL